MTPERMGEIGRLAREAPGSPLADLLDEYRSALQVLADTEGELDAAEADAERAWYWAENYPIGVEAMEQFASDVAAHDARRKAAQ